MMRELNSFHNELQQDERQGQRHQPYEEQENESKFENDQKDES